MTIRKVVKVMGGGGGGGGKNKKYSCQEGCLKKEIGQTKTEFLQSELYCLAYKLYAANSKVVAALY